jgi:hypothetical protein
MVIVVAGEGEYTWVMVVEWAGGGSKIRDSATMVGDETNGTKP